MRNKPSYANSYCYEPPGTEDQTYQILTTLFIEISRMKRIIERLTTTDFKLEISGEEFTSKVYTPCNIIE
ncbi:hypothetical protein COU57_06560 [Candidatus Pacearchaeota archaeon CG10_big_fil_rev_8_21_14_0_10_32_14]|nr:MAG: hypothetical protein COU57_06560 [Candidatus Pacearchaeota archaeon CG10_big_fil_rev_8_21_14_0_10_32_14]